jgi:hypothetical protein
MMGILVPESCWGNKTTYFCHIWLVLYLSLCLWWTVTWTSKYAKKLLSYSAYCSVSLLIIFSVFNYFYFVTTEDLRFKPQQGKKYFSTPECPYQLLGPTHPPVSGYRGLFLQVKCNHEVMLRTHLNYALSLIISETMPSPHMLSWHTKGQSTYEYILLPDSQKRPLSEVTMQWTCAICYMKDADEHKMDMCHLLYGNYKWLRNGCVLFDVQTQYS